MTSGGNLKFAFGSNIAFPHKNHCARLSVLRWIQPTSIYTMSKTSTSNQLAKRTSLTRWQKGWFFLVRNPRLQNNRQCFYLRKSTERTFCSFYNGHWVPIWTANRWRTSSPTVIRWTMCDVGKSMMCRSSLDKVTCGVSSTQTCLFCYFRTDLYERSQYSGLTLHLWDIPTEARFKEMNMLVQLKPDEAEHGYAWETLSDQNIVDWIKRGMALIDTIGDYA